MHVVRTPQWLLRSYCMCQLTYLGSPWQPITRWTFKPVRGWRESRVTPPSCRRVTISGGVCSRCPACGASPHAIASSRRTGRGLSANDNPQHAGYRTPGPHADSQSHVLCLFYSAHPRDPVSCPTTLPAIPQHMHICRLLGLSEMKQSVARAPMNSNPPPPIVPYYATSYPGG